MARCHVPECHQKSRCTRVGSRLDKVRIEIRVIGDLECVIVEVVPCSELNSPIFRAQPAQGRAFPKQLTDLLAGHTQFDWTNGSMGMTLNLSMSDWAKESM